MKSQRVLSAIGTPQQEWNFTINEIIHCNPVIAELGSDSGLEIVFGADDFKVYCLNSTGHQKWTYTTGGDVDAVSVADVDNDGDPEVIVASFDDIYCLSSTGSFEWSYAAPSAIRSTPCLANLDGDPYLEILFGSYYDELYCIDGAGALEWTFSSDYIRASPVVVDIDGSGAPDVLVGDLEDGLFYCLSAVGSQRWARNIGPSGTNPSSCFVTDLDGDGELEILVSSVNKEMYCLNYNGSIRWSYTDVMFDGLCSTPTSADLNEADGLETIVCSWDEVHCVNSTGGWVWDYDAESVIRSSQCIVDVDGDGELEIIVGKGDFNINSGLLCLSASGVLEWTYDTSTEVESAPCAADVDGDGAIEVFFVSYDTLSDTGIVYCLSVVDSPIQSSSYNWPSIGFMGDVSRTGYFEDSDSDLLIDNYEVSAGSSPSHVDTDTDERTDYLEFLESTDPTLDLVFPSNIDDLVVIKTSSNSV
ncbi:MAG: PQQ-binding-like beta-propeller repeat protein, partial [Candidatus Thorarchaeota archaeon]